MAQDEDGTHSSGLGAEKFEKLLNKQLNGSRTALKVVSQSFRSIPVYPHQFSEHQLRVRQHYNDMSGATRNSELRGDSDALLVLFDPLLQVPRYVSRDIDSEQTPPRPPPSDVSDYAPHPSFCTLFHSAGVLPAVQVPFCAPVRELGAVILLTAVLVYMGPIAMLLLYCVRIIVLTNKSCMFCAFVSRSGHENTRT